MIENVIIIGGGPAGLAASIYNARAGLKPLVIAGSPPGGQLTLTSEVENYPGFESILGPDLIDRMRKHALKFGVRLIDENVVKVDFSKEQLEINIAKRLDTAFLDRLTLKGPRRLSQNGYLRLFTKAVIIATGAKALWLNLPSETRLRGKGVSACATCDGFFFRDKTVAVVGGGDTAMKEALTLTKFAKKVYIIHRRDFLRASKIMQDRVFANKRIEIIWNSTIKEVLGDVKVSGIKLKSQMSNPCLPAGRVKSTSKILNLDGVFIAIGYKPDTELFNGKIKLDEKGYIVVNKLMTSVPGVFAAGDCVDNIYRQVATAVGTGVAAALEVEKYLASA